jgi:hypothetical protein
MHDKLKLTIVQERRSHLVIGRHRMVRLGSVVICNTLRIASDPVRYQIVPLKSSPLSSAVAEHIILCKLV